MIFDSIKINKRTFNTNTHNNLVDEHIKEIRCFRVSIIKLIIAIILYILSLGILFIITLISPSLYIKMVLEECSIESCNYFVILDNELIRHLIKASREDYHTMNVIMNYLIDPNILNYKEKLKNSNYIGIEFWNAKDNVLVMNFRHNKYIYIEKEKMFFPLQFDLLNYKNNEIHEKFFKGIDNSLDFNYLLNKFGKNVIELSNKSYGVIVLENIIKPYTLYQCLSVVIWFINSYWIFGVIVIFLLLLTILVDSYQTYLNYQRSLAFSMHSESYVVRNLNCIDNEINIQEKIDILQKESTYIVPGDIIELTSKDIIPCDALLLDGILFL